MSDAVTASRYAGVFAAPTQPSKGMPKMYTVYTALKRDPLLSISFNINVEDAGLFIYRESA